MSRRLTRSLLVVASGLTLATLLSGCQSAPPAATSTTAAVPTSAPPSGSTPAAAAKPTAASTSGAVTKPAAAVDACALLPPEEVQAAVGVAVVPQPDPTAGTQASGCSYLDATTRSRMASTVVYAASPGEAKGIHEATKGGGRDQVAVPGIGEDAYWDNDDRSLQVLRGGYAVGLTISSLDKTGAQNAAKTLAPKLLGRLP